jgi:phosphatidylinositol-3-phosphatase
MNCLKSALAAILCTAAMGAVAGETPSSHGNGPEGSVPNGIPRLDHVFVIMLENHGFQQVVNNPTMPFINSLITDKNISFATNYFAVGHPSLTNYLEIVGGSNFRVRSDNSPDWHNLSCRPNIATGVTNADNDNAPNPPPIPIEQGNVCPISGTGTDATTEAVDSWNETEPGFINFMPNIDGVKSVPSAPTVGKTIADQLARAGLSWKTYQENLPLTGADNISLSNGTSTDLTTFNPNAKLSFNNLPPLTAPEVLHAYAVKHNPFAYFKSTQEGSENNSLRNMVGFDGHRGLYSDLASGEVPSFSYIVPNQCNDQHGQNNADAYCAEDQGTPFFTAQGQALTDGTQVGLNPGLSANADVTVEKIVTSIRKSPAWRRGYNAIVVVYDENDYSGPLTAPPANTVFPSQYLNRVILTVETNSEYARGVHSKNFYNSFSLLKSLEAGFRLQCLNHACDHDVNVMSDLFGEGH